MLPTSKSSVSPFVTTVVLSVVLRIALGRIAGIAMGHYRGRGTPVGSMASGLEEDASSTTSSSQVHLRGGSPRNQTSRTQARLSGAPGIANSTGAALYLLGERSMMKVCLILYGPLKSPTDILPMYNA